MFTLGAPFIVDFEKKQKYVYFRGTKYSWLSETKERKKKKVCGRPSVIVVVFFHVQKRYGAVKNAQQSNLVEVQYGKKKKYNFKKIDKLC